MEKLQELLDSWNRWAKTADQTEDGWQSDFPQWSALVDAAWRAHCDGPVDATKLASLGQVWALSTEGEDILTRVVSFWNGVAPLSSSQLPECRWQVYEAAGSVAATAQSLLRAGVFDTDAYSRRRAILSLARVRPADAAELAAQLIKDVDPYIRQAAVQMVLAVDDDGFRMELLTTLAADPIEHVRLAALAAMGKPARGT